MQLRCPTCKAIYKGDTQCYRCQSDLTYLVTILQQEAILKKRVINFLREGHYEDAEDTIRQLLLLHKTSEGEELEALVAAARGNFRKVLKILH
ncbi:MAG: hypothetical protein V1872_11640 [bacterium]